MSELSGKFVLRVEPSLHQKLKATSDRKGMSLNRYCVSQLEAPFENRAKGSEYFSFGLPLERLRHLIVTARLPVIGCILFGSVARGESDASSDIDLLLVLPKGHPPDRELYSVWDRAIRPETQQSVIREVSPQFALLPNDWETAGSLWFEVAIEGIVLWDDSAEINVTLVQIRKAMAQGKIERQISHGHPFWIRRKE